MEEELTEAESEQMRRFAILQKVAGLILRKWCWLLIFVFFGLSAAFSAYLVWRTAKSGHRFEATTRLLYSPRQVAHIQNMNERQLLTILERGSLKRRVANVIQLSAYERMCLVSDLTLTQEKRTPNLFTLTAAAPSLAAAARKVNAYAEALIDEYVAYRSHDLDNWREALATRKQGLHDQLAALDSEAGALKGQTGVVAPVESLTMVNKLLSDQRRNLSLLSIDIANEELKKKKQSEGTGDIGAVVAANAATIRRKSAEIAAVDAEIAKLREIYTDINPKVAGKLDDRATLLEAYTAFLQEKGIESLDLAEIERLERAASELAETSMKLDALYENRRALELEIAGNEKRADELTNLIPAYERLQVKRSDLEMTMRDLDEQERNIVFLQMSIRNDLQQIERAAGADDKNPFRVKNFAIAIGGAVVCTLVLAFWLLSVEFAFGRVIGLDEMLAHGDFQPLGSLPRPGAMKEDDEKDVFGVVAMKFASVDIAKGVVLDCRLPGAPEQPKFRAALEWSLAMAGARALWMEVVPSAEFVPPEGAESMINAVCKGDRGWFPVENRYAIAPTELQMLQADLMALRDKFEHVFVSMPGGIRRGGSFFDQLLTVCDCVMTVAGAGKTPRGWFAYALKHIREAKRPALALSVGASAKTVRREMEDRK